MALIEIDTNTNQIREVDSGSGLGALLSLLLFIFIIFSAIIGEEQKTKKLIDNVKLYCNSTQLEETGEIKCLGAKRELRERYIGFIEERKIGAKNAEDNKEPLRQIQEEKCSKEGLINYGKQGCEQATNDYQNNLVYHEQSLNTISYYQTQIEKIAKYGILPSFPASHVVNADLVNLRSCPQMDCQIITQLDFGTGVILESEDKTWARVTTSVETTGYIAKKFLLEYDGPSVLDEE